MGTEDNKLIMVLKDVHLGKIKVPNKTVINQLKKVDKSILSLGKNEDEIIINTQAVKVLEAGIENNLVQVKYDYGDSVKKALADNPNMGKK
ncbi:hypothetical protein [Clostridium yunnanense]|uniref:hypothetical protein n=1 Tax=Clostridium yunnanense TaxID=2800325 RepID=UPI001FAD238E|nr:hypothetical protein [Clostridium yunnanense]